MNLVLDDAEEVHMKTKNRKPLGKIILPNFPLFAVVNHYEPEILKEMLKNEFSLSSKFAMHFSLWKFAPIKWVSGF